MRRIEVKSLKSKLSECLRLVAAGESLLVTDRDRVIAELIPPREGRASLASEAVLAEAILKGLITPATRPSSTAPPRLPVDRTSNILRDLESDRADQ